MSRRLIGISAIIICFGFLLGIQAQTLAFRQYTVKDGLPSSYLYDIEQDSSGFIWLTTEGGICKFDGINFDNNPISELASEEIIKMKFDQRGRLWMSMLNGQVTYYEKGKVHRLGPFRITDSEYYSKLPISSVEEDKDGNIWLLSPLNRALRLDLVKGDSILEKRWFEFPLISARALLEIGGEVAFMGRDGFSKVIDDSLIVHPFRNEGKEVFPANFAVEDDGQILFSSYSKVNRYDPATGWVHPFFTEYDSIISRGVNSIFLDRDGNYWLPAKDGVLFLRRRADGTFFQNHYLKGHFVSLATQDRNGNYWFITQKKGMFLLPSTDISILDKDFGLTSNMITALATDYKGRLVVGCDDNSYNVVSLGDAPNVVFREKLSRENHEIYDIFLHESGDNWFFTSRGLHILPAGKNMVRNKEPIAKTSYKVARQASDGSVWMGASGFGARLSNGRNIPKIFNRIYAVEPIDKREAWFGTVDGLYHYKEEQGARLMENPKLQTDIRDIRLQENGKLWLATKLEGLIVFKGERVVRHLTTKDGLPSNNCRAILLEDGYAWIATNEGIARIGLKDYDIMTIDMNDGLPSREVNDIIRVGDMIVAGTNAGVAYFSKELETHSPPPHLVVTSVRISEKDTLISDAYTLDYGNNNIKVSFVAMAFQASNDLFYHTKMEGVDKGWITNTTGIAEYPSLSSGDFTLRIRAKTSDSPWSEERVIRFAIRKPYWKTWWFYILAGLALVSVTALISSGVNKYYIQRVRGARARLRESRLMALRAQMNPHFMFNSLNAIQEFILTKDQRAANKYLSQFSKLMRSILDMSDKTSIPLKKELEALRLYLELETMRFDGNLDYHILVDKELDQVNTMLPSMLIQPYVENAIIHGLMHKPDDRQLYVRFRKQGRYLVCEVEDNGIGRAAALEMRKRNVRNYESKAMSVTRERLRLINSTSKENLSVDIIDKWNPDGSVAGTKVVIYIPFKYQ